MGRVHWRHGEYGQGCPGTGQGTCPPTPASCSTLRQVSGPGPLGEGHGWTARGRQPEGGAWARGEAGPPRLVPPGWCLLPGEPGPAARPGHLCRAVPGVGAPLWSPGPFQAPLPRAPEPPLRPALAVPFQDTVWHPATGQSPASCSLGRALEPQRTWAPHRGPGPGPSDPTEETDAAQPSIPRVATLAVLTLWAAMPPSRQRAPQHRPRCHGEEEARGARALLPDRGGCGAGVQRHEVEVLAVARGPCACWECPAVVCLPTSALGPGSHHRSPGLRTQVLGTPEHTPAALLSTAAPGGLRAAAPQSSQTLWSARLLRWVSPEGAVVLGRPSGDRALSSGRAGSGVQGRSRCTGVPCRPVWEGRIHRRQRPHCPARAGDPSPQPAQGHSQAHCPCAGPSPRKAAPCQPACPRQGTLWTPAPGPSWPLSVHLGHLCPEHLSVLRPPQVWGHR